MQSYDLRFGAEEYPYKNRTQVANKSNTAQIGMYLGKRIKCHRPHFWGNPMKITDTQNRQQVIKQYLQILWKSPEKIRRLHELTGSMLVCYCSPEDCHCDVLAAFADTFGAAQLAGLGQFLPDLQGLPEVDSPLLSYRKETWIMVWGAFFAQGKDLYSVVRAVLDDFLSLYIGRIIGDISGGRINAANVKPQEWDFIEEVATLDWFVPNGEQWALVQGLLGLFDLRRGFSYKLSSNITDGALGVPYVVQQGTAQIRLGFHGRKALVAKQAGGKPYEAGKVLTMDELSLFLSQAERDLLE